MGLADFLTGQSSLVRHGAPGRLPNPLVEGMQPAPPPLDEPALVQMRHVRHRDIDYEDLTVVDHIVTDLIRGDIDRDEARSRLMKVVSSGHRRPRWVAATVHRYPDQAAVEGTARAQPAHARHLRLDAGAPADTAAAVPLST